jgi:oligosaccharide reducing-end xylanase
MFRIRCVLLTTVLALCQTLLPATGKDAERGAFYTGQYRDLFAEIGHPPDESRARINAAFQQLFHGDQRTQTLFYEVGGNNQGALAYITDIANHDVRTEGMSYGMMISVQMNRKHEFDALWNWANTYMLITDRKDPGFGYYKWSMNIDGSPHSSTPAPDGEEYFVMSLYFAANRWGAGSGLYNYKAQADRLLHLMRHHSGYDRVNAFRNSHHRSHGR